MHLFMLLNPLVIAFSKCYRYTSIPTSNVLVLNMVVLALVFYGACYRKSCISFLLLLFTSMKLTDLFDFCYC